MLSYIQSMSLRSYESRQDNFGSQYAIFYLSVIIMPFSMFNCLEVLESRCGFFKELQLRGCTAKIIDGVLGFCVVWTNN